MHINIYKIKYYLIIKFKFKSNNFLNSNNNRFYYYNIVFNK